MITHNDEIWLLKQGEASGINELQGNTSFVESADKMKTLAQSLAANVSSGYKDGRIDEKLEKLQQRVESQDRNCLSFAQCGGLKSLMYHQLKHPDPETRVLANNIFATVVSKKKSLMQIL